MRANVRPSSSSKYASRFERWGDEQLARAARDGCAEARNVLFLKHRTVISRLGVRARRLVMLAEWAGRVNPPIELEDVDQQAFVLFCELLDWWQPEREPFMVCLKRKLPWMLHHYVHVTLAGRGGVTLLQTVPFVDITGETVDPSLSTGASEVRVAWRENVKMLPPSLRRTVLLRYYGGLSSAQVATLTGRTTREINRKLRSALSILRDQIQEEWYDI